MTSMENSCSLSKDEINNLLITLENTKKIISNYVDILESYEVKKETVQRRKSWWGRHCWPKKRRWIYRFIIIVTVCLQFLNLLVISFLDAVPKPDKDRPYVLAGSATMIVLQLMNLLFLILASGRLARQIYRHAVNRLTLAQTYGATILLFAGLYTLTYRLQRHSWKFINEDLNDDPVQVFLLYAKFLFYSISTATLCGSDNILPLDWYNCLFAGVQMLLSFCYFASILGSAIGEDNNSKISTPAALTGSHQNTANSMTNSTDGCGSYDFHRQDYQKTSKSISCSNFSNNNSSSNNISSNEINNDRRSMRLFSRESFGTDEISASHAINVSSEDIARRVIITESDGDKRQQIIEDNAQRKPITNLSDKETNVSFKGNNNSAFVSEFDSPISVLINDKPQECPPVVYPSPSNLTEVTIHNLYNESQDDALNNNNNLTSVTNNNNENLNNFHVVGNKITHCGRT